MNIEQWKTLIVSALNCNSSEEYAFYQGVNKNGTFTGLFAKRQCFENITDFYLCTISAKVDKPENKGSTALRFQLGDTTLAFINCHLGSSGKPPKRVKALQKVLSQAFAKSKGLYQE